MATVLTRPCPCSRNRELCRNNTSFLSCSAFFIRSFEGRFVPKRGNVSLSVAIGACRVSHVEEQGMHETCASLAAHSIERLNGFHEALCGRAMDRREALALLVLTSFGPLQHWDMAVAADGKVKFPLILESYIDEKEGFTLLKPTQWNKIEKSGATVLFEDPQSKGNNVGVVVNPVRISSLMEFGTKDIVADKLLQAEKKKPTTNNVQFIKVNERQVHGGAPLYQLEYKLDSSRGIKRILSAVTVASKKLYVLNIAYADSSEEPLQPDTASLLEQIVNSFDVL